MSKYIQVYDGEFSAPGTSKGSIIALAGLIVKKDTLEVVDTFMEYARVPKEKEKFWSSRSENAHRIPISKTRTFQPQREFLLKLMKFLKPYLSPNKTPITFVMHGSNFVDFTYIQALFKDQGLLNSFDKVFNRNDVIRTDMIYKQYKRIIDNQDIRYSGLKYMAKDFGLELKHHEAMSDTKCCYEGLKKMANTFKDVGDIWSKNHLPDYDHFNTLVSGL